MAKQNRQGQSFEREALFPMAEITVIKGDATLRTRTIGVKETFRIVPGRDNAVMGEEILSRTFLAEAGTGGGTLFSACGLDSSVNPPAAGSGFGLNLPGLVAEWRAQQGRARARNIKDVVKAGDGPAFEAYQAKKAELFAANDKAVEAAVEAAEEGQKAEAGAAAKRSTAAIEEDAMVAVVEGIRASDSARADKVASLFDAALQRLTGRQQIFRKVVTQDGAMFSLLAYVDWERDEFVILLSGGGFRTTLDYRVDCWNAPGVRVSFDLKTAAVKKVEQIDERAIQAHPQLIQRPYKPRVVVPFTMITPTEGTWPVFVHIDHQGNLGATPLAGCFADGALQPTGDPTLDTVVHPFWFEPSEADPKVNVAPHYRFVRSYEPGKARSYRVSGEGGFSLDTSGFGEKKIWKIFSGDGSQWHAMSRNPEDADGESVGMISVRTGSTAPAAS